MQDSPATKLTARHLVGLTFFSVCGGDYGIEDAVGAAGPFWTLLGLLIVPWLWSLPIALMTAELGAMIPDMGGPVVWVDRAFGPFVAHCNAYTHLVANFFDNALYPVMFADYLREFHPALCFDGLPRYLLSASMLVCVTLLNVAGVANVADVSTLFTVLVVSPFFALVICGLPTLDPSAWLIGSGLPSERSGSSSGGGSELAASFGGGGGGGVASSGAPDAANDDAAHAAVSGGGGGVRWGTYLALLLWNT